MTVDCGELYHVYNHQLINLNSNADAADRERPYYEKNREIDNYGSTTWSFPGRSGSNSNTNLFQLIMVTHIKVSSVPHPNPSN